MTLIVDESVNGDMVVKTSMSPFYTWGTDKSWGDEN